MRVLCERRGEGSDGCPGFLFRNVVPGADASTPQVVGPDDERGAVEVLEVAATCRARSVLPAREALPQMSPLLRAEVTRQGVGADISMGQVSSRRRS
ncbi:MAG: hypothetical protein K0S37_2093 [Microbacterium sp.]|nr:hypothetical protein [Microbacterium sp.]